MSKRYDIMTPRKGNEKTFWTRIGTAWQNDKGSIQLVFDALPIPDSEGRVVASLFEPRENNAPRSATGRGESRQPYNAPEEINDDIPF